MCQIEDVHGNSVEITKEEQWRIWSAEEEARHIEEFYYPSDGSQDHIDHHIYGQLRECFEEIEEVLKEKYKTSFCLI